MAKTLAHITEEISKPWSGKLDKKGKFDYIPWEEAQKEAIRIFDVDGYDITVINPPAYASQLDEETGKLTHGYQATVRVTVYPSDGRPFSRDGVGYTAITRYGSGEMGLMPAVKGSVSAALVRALSLVGYHFGLSLYEGEDTVGAPAQAAAAGTQRTYSAGSADRRPSQPQLNVLHDRGYTDAQVDAMDFTTWKGVIDAIFNKTTPTIAPAGKPTPRPSAGRKPVAVAAAAAADGDEFPF